MQRAELYQFASPVLPYAEESAVAWPLRPSDRRCLFRLPAGGPWPHAQRPPLAHTEQHPVQTLGWVGHHHTRPGDPHTLHAERGSTAVEDAVPVPLRGKAGELWLRTRTLQGMDHALPTRLPPMCTTSGPGFLGGLLKTQQ